MRQTDRLKGKIYKLLEAGQFNSYIASFDITEDLPKKPPGTFHLAFAKNSLDRMEIALYNLDVVPTRNMLCRTMEELLTNIAEYGCNREVFPRTIHWFFNSGGLTMEQFQALVRQACEELDLS